MMGGEGLRAATESAILHANYVARCLAPHYPVLYSGPGGLVAHECILDLRPLKATSGIEVEDVAKRLIDYGFHAPTMSFPVAGTLMVEPTESESKYELDRFIDAMIAIRGEIRAVEEGELDRDDNPLKHAPHTAAAVSADAWTHRYSRSLAAYPPGVAKQSKYWPPVARVDNVYGDRNLFCSCIPMAEHEAALMRVVVLGAGVVGVTAAWYLAPGRARGHRRRSPRGRGARDVVRQRRPDLRLVRGAVGESGSTREDPEVAGPGRRAAAVRLRLDPRAMAVGPAVPARMPAVAHAAQHDPVPAPRAVFARLPARRCARDRASQYDHLERGILSFYTDAARVRARRARRRRSCASSAATAT